MIGFPWRLVIVGLLFVGVASVGFFGYRYIKGMQDEIVSLQINLQNEQTARKLTETRLANIQGNIAANDARIAQLNGEVAVTREQVSGMQRLFADHDLEKLARAKPGLISKKMKVGTVDIFTQLEAATRE
jgi:uncharacterized protein HemX